MRWTPRPGFAVLHSGEGAFMPGTMITTPLSADERAFLLVVARRAIAAFLHREELPHMETASGSLLVHRASFVTLREAPSGQLRGCRGECPPRRSLIESVVRMAVAAATDDPRFPPVESGELDRLVVSISALGPIQPISPEDVEVGRHGLLLTRGFHAGLLLPHVPTSLGWDRTTYLEGVCQKAGLPPQAWQDPESELFGFEAETWSETDVPGGFDAPAY